MKTNVSIPTPCTEDWSKMTPTNKGAFCDKCAFEVIDFTKQSPEEIRDTLKQRMGERTCGHISKVQMDLVNSNYHLWENQSPRTFKSKFLYACLMVFGMTLFTACSSGSEEGTTGEIEVHDEIIDGGMEVEMGMVEEDTTFQCTDDLIEGEMETGDMIFREDEK